MAWRRGTKHIIKKTPTIVESDGNQMAWIRGGANISSRIWPIVESEEKHMGRIKGPKEIIEPISTIITSDEKYMYGGSSGLCGVCSSKARGQKSQVSEEQRRQTVGNIF